MTGISLLTINLWGTNGPADRRMSDLADHLAARGPDVVVMQEVAGTGTSTQAHRIAAAAGYEVLSSVRTGITRGEGLAVIARVEGRDLGLVDLPSSVEDHPRGLQLVDVTVPAGEHVRIGNTHLAWRLDHTDLRTTQADAVLAAVAGNGPTVVAGDLNDVPGSPPLDRFDAAGFVDAYGATNEAEGWTFHPDNPFVTQRELTRRRIDHVLVRGLEVLDSAIVLDGEDGPVVSDHHGVRAELCFGGPGT
jgi:endonuclease/exonuclease/phosphatase family metal-dependent hydrolase